MQQDSQPSVSSLPDDENVVAQLSDDEPRRALDAVPAYPRPEKRPLKAKLPPNAFQWKQQFARMAGSVCGCARQRRSHAASSCFRQFQGSVDELVQLRVRLQSLHKQDMDNEACHCMCLKSELDSDSQIFNVFASPL
eukprot:s6555_g1.t1